MAINLNHIDNSILIGTSEKVRITSGGYVNIGGNYTQTTNLLQVAGAIQCLNKLESTTGNDLILNAGSANRDVKIQVNDTNIVYVQGSTAKVGVGIDSPDSKLHIHNGSAGSIAASSSANLTIESSASDYNVLQFLSPNTANQQIRFGDPQDNGAGYINYDHNNSRLTIGVNGPEKLRIDSSGRLLLGTTTEGYSSADDLTIATSGHTGITIRSGTSNEGAIFFSDGTSGDAEYRGYIQYKHASDALLLATGAAEKLRITSGGFLGIGSGSSTNKPLHIYRASDDAEIRLQTNSGTEQNSYIALRQATGDLDFYTVQSGTNMKFHTVNAERLRITGAGNIIPGTNNATNIGDGTTNFNSIWASTRFRGNDNVKLVLGASQNLVVRYDGTDNIIGSPVGDDLHIKSGTGDNDNQLIASFKHSNASVGIGIADPTELFHVQKNHNGHTRAIIQNNWGANATAQLKLISPTDEFQIVKYAAGSAALNLSNNSTMYMSIGGATRVQIRGDSTGQTTHIVNTPSPGGNGVMSQYVTQPYGMSGNYTNFRVTVTASGWHSFFLKMYVSGYSGDSAYRWVTGYCNNGFGTIRTSHSDNSGDFGTGTLTHISGQSWRYDIAVTSGSVTHPVMFVELAVAGSGNITGNGAVVCAIT